MKKIILALFCLCLSVSLTAKQWHILSPNKRMSMIVCANKHLTWQVSHDETMILMPSRIALETETDGILGISPKVRSARTQVLTETIATPLYKRSEVHSNYTQFMLSCYGGFDVEFRLYDDAAAYRFIMRKQNDLNVVNEVVEFNFADDYQAFIPYVNDNRGGYRYSYSFESYYDEQTLSSMFADSLAITPLLVQLSNQKKVAIMETDVDDYPGMFLLRGDHPHSLKAAFAPCPLEGEWGGWMMMNFIPTKCADYIANTKGNRTFPWRAIYVSTTDLQLADNDLARRLSRPSELDDISWIRPGKVAWDWWNTTNISGVNFKAGMNTQTYCHFIDFAAENNLEYIIIDAGWSGQRNDWKGNSLMNCISEIDLPQVVAHGNEKGVGVILWASWALCDKECHEVFPYYANMGIKGFKVDFLDADDQHMIQSMKRIVKTAADNHLLIDLHGMKPTGIQSAYPNVLNFEGVKGLENCKWAAMDGNRSKEDFLRYDVIIPFTRMMCGPMDYTPGAMNNAQRDLFRPINDHPMSQGTRVHQMAMYTVFEAPLQMLADAPTAYRKNQECTDFIASVPTVFDQTIALGGEVGEYVAIARRNGNTWWIGVLNNWTPRELQLNLKPVLEQIADCHDWQIEIFQDGVNADSEATDYEHCFLPLDAVCFSSHSSLSVRLAPGGGWTAKIYPRRIM